MYIKREDALAEVAKRMHSPHMQDSLQVGTSKSIWYAIKEVPSADVVERKRGHWTDIYEDTKGYIGRCSECKEVSLSGFLYIHKFCPKCGADMRERKDNELHT